MSAHQYPGSPYSALPALTQDYLNSLAALAPPNVLDLRFTMQHHDESKYVSAYFDPAHADYRQQIEILAITDVQFGHLCCNIARFVEFRDWVLREANRFVFFLGDMVDAATAISVASPYENTEEPQGQVFRFVELALPLRHRVIGYVGGNHERRAVKTFGDLGHLIATLLKIPYSAGRQYIDVHYGKHQPFRNTLWHGTGAARTKGAKAQMLHRFMTQGDSQMYWVGHLHDVLMLFDWREKRVSRKIHLEKFAGVMSSSFLHWWGTYAEVAGLAPSDCMMARVILEPTGKWEITWR